MYAFTLVAITTTNHPLNIKPIHIYSVIYRSQQQNRTNRILTHVTNKWSKYFHFIINGYHIFPNVCEHSYI